MIRTVVYDPSGPTAVFVLLAVAHCVGTWWFASPARRRPRHAP